MGREREVERTRMGREGRSSILRVFHSARRCQSNASTKQDKLVPVLTAADLLDGDRSHDDWDCDCKEKVILLKESEV
jgi:hypothetical protein